MKRFLSVQGILISAILFPMVFLPVMHLHPASDSPRHSEINAYRQQAVVHADFFPNASHQVKVSEKDSEGADISSHLSGLPLSEIDLLSPHIAQSFQFSSVFKKKLSPLNQVSFRRAIPSYFQKKVLIREHAPPLKSPQFTPPLLRGPPSLA